MYDIIRNFETNFFVDAAKFGSSPKNISKLMTEFGEEGFIPRTFDEIGPSRKSRVGLVTTDSKWEINILSDRFNIEHKPQEVGNLGLEISGEFAEKATSYVERLLKLIKRKGFRMAFVSNGMLEEMDQVKLENIFEKIVNPIDFYKSSKPFEWNTRSVSNDSIRIARKAEELNVITMINRIRGAIQKADGGKMDFDRIELSFDINTVAINDDERFRANHLKEFIEKANKIRLRIAEEFQSAINE
ncbi:MAG: hypothetical protein GKR91_05535 [Pseudomonadales bacterium]|nr:hypothetical protein [Pseudomonadales bacterium]